MSLELIKPDGLPTPAAYTQVIVATGQRLIFVAGQVAVDAEGTLVGTGDLAAQARQAFEMSAPRRSEEYEQGLRRTGP
jgi:enamine deaminase RidA (YjgF/YER057c/UK114 family)